MHKACLLLLWTIPNTSALAPANAHVVTPLISKPQLSRSSLLLANGGGDAVSTSFGGSLLRRYLDALEASPLPVKMITSATLGGIGDLIAQCLDSGGGFSAARLLAIMLTNGIYIAPLFSLLYELNERLVGEVLQLPSRTWQGATLRVTLDQLVCAPIGIFGFFWFFGLLEPLLSFSVHSLADYGALGGVIRNKLCLEYFEMLRSSWQIWVLPQLVNFSLMPAPLRVPFASVTALVWGVVQSTLANR